MAFVEGVRVTVFEAMTEPSALRSFTVRDTLVQALVMGTESVVKGEEFVGLVVSFETSPQRVLLLESEAVIVAGVLLEAPPREPGKESAEPVQRVVMVAVSPFW